jgi:ATP-dependent Clp protease ATP-binding subunit ClpA
MVAMTAAGHEDKLHERVVGQEEAIGAVANAIRRFALLPTRAA